MNCCEIYHNSTELLAPQKTQTIEPNYKQEKKKCLWWEVFKHLIYFFLLYKLIKYIKNEYLK